MGMRSNPTISRPYRYSVANGRWQRETYADNLAYIKFNTTNSATGDITLGTVTTDSSNRGIIYRYMISSSISDSTTIGIVVGTTTYYDTIVGASRIDVRADPEADPLFIVPASTTVTLVAVDTTTTNETFTGTLFMKLEPIVSKLEPK